MTPRRPSGRFELPAYPYDRLGSALRKAAALPGGAVDLSIGTPTDPPPAGVIEALGRAEPPEDPTAVRGYPSSVGSPALRQAIRRWTGDRFGVDVDPEAIGVCVGTKEFVATVPQWLSLRQPDRDTVLYPAVSYPTYAMGATLAGLRPVPVPLDDRWCLDLAQVDERDAARALLLWANTPGNPAGGLDDLPAVARWAAERSIPVFSDECYVEFTWRGPGRTILGHGGGPAGLGGVVAVHSLSKRSNLAGLRIGWYAGDEDLVDYLRELRKHAGLMVPGPVQSAAVAALEDHEHVDRQRGRYLERLERLLALFSALGVEGELPGGGFYLWLPAPDGDAWAFTERLAATAGMIVSPGEFYGDAGSSRVRVAAVASLDRIELVAARLGV
jgi:aspartate/methionine/tyrosine aminotransferase